MEKNKTSILVIIIILLLIMIPLTLLGTYLKFSNYTIKETPKKNSQVEQTDSNSNQEKYQNGVLYFYDNENKLLGSYECQKAPCSYAVSTIDDQNYAIEYLESKSQEVNIIQNRYAFINDDGEIKLYDISSSEVLNTYTDIKNYHNMLDYNTMIVKDKTNKWGVIKFDEQVNTIIDFQYDFIGLIDLINEDNLLNSDNFIVKKENLWGIVDKEGDLISNYLAGEITSYNQLLISVKVNNDYYLYDYYGKRVVDEKGFNYISFTDKYINIVDKNDNLYIYDYGNDKKISSNMKLPNSNYKEAFNSILNTEKNTIDVTINNKTYSYNI